MTPVMKHFIAVTERLIETFQPVDLFGRVPHPALGNTLLMKAG